jgi:hypothetical protein
MTNTGGGGTTNAVIIARRSFLALALQSMHLLRKPSGEPGRGCQQAFVTGLITLQPIQAFEGVSGTTVHGTFFLESALHALQFREKPLGRFKSFHQNSEVNGQQSLQRGQYCSSSTKSSGALRN